MRHAPPAARIAVLLALVAVLAAGYVVGRGSSTPTPVVRMRTSLVSADVVLTYPASWRRAKSAPEIPGLSIGNSAGMAPGDDSKAGLVVGQLPGGEPSPLPARFLAGLRARPAGEVVNLTETQAYRYSRLSVSGFRPTVTLYSIPNPDGNPTVLACYATAALSADMRACERIVATLTLAGQPPSYALAPDSGYARAVDAAIAQLEGQRVALRRALAHDVSPADAGRLATRSAQGFAGAAAAVSGLEPASAAGRAQDALLRSLGRARDAYTGLAAAASSRDQGGYASARARVYEAEAGVDAALESFVLLGYKRS